VHLTLAVATAQHVHAVLYDAPGRESPVLYEGALAANQQAYVSFSTGGLPAGTYVVRASGEDVSAIQRVVVR